MPQETNMAELLRLMNTVIVKVDGLATDMTEVKASVARLETRFDNLETRFDNLETRFDHLENKVDILSGQFQDVARVVMEDTRSIKVIEGRVSDLEGKAH